MRTSTFQWMLLKRWWFAFIFYFIFNRSVFHHIKLLLYLNKFYFWNFTQLVTTTYILIFNNCFPNSHIINLLFILFSIFEWKISDDSDTISLLLLFCAVVGTFAALFVCCCPFCLSKQATWPKGKLHWNFGRVRVISDERTYKMTLNPLVRIQPSKVLLWNDGSTSVLYRYKYGFSFLFWFVHDISQFVFWYPFSYNYDFIIWLVYIFSLVLGLVFLVSFLN